MKKIVKNMATAAFAFAALAAPLAALAATDGDIYEIRPVDETGAVIAAPTAPLDGGDVARFVVRLVKPTPVSRQFRLHHVGLGSEASDLVFNRPAIGVYVNGVFTLAYLEKWGAKDEYFTDFVFSYTVKPGDFAQPMRLANIDKEMVTDNLYEPSKSYYFNFLDSGAGVAAWQVDDSTETEAMTRKANFIYGNGSVFSPPDPPRQVDYDLKKCNFRIQTVDFDSEDESTTYWRTVHQHATEAQPVGAIPSLVVSGVPTNTVTLYVWSENEDAVKLIAGRDALNVTTRPVHVTATTTESREVAEIKIVAGKQDYAFNMLGVAKDKDATIVLSAFPDFNYSSGTNVRLTDEYLTRTVRCIEPMPASVTIKPGKSTVTATSDYTTYATELNVALSENPIDHDFEVTIVPEFTETSCPNKWWDYFRLATTTDADPALTTPTGNPRLHFATGSTVPSSITVPTASGDITTSVTDGKLYLFALRSDEFVTGANKITFKVTTADADASKSSSDGGIDGWGVTQSSLAILADNPAVVSMFDGTDKAAAVAGADRTLQIVVSDVYADMHAGPSDGYEIWIEKNTDTDLEFTKLPGLYYPGKGNVLFLTNSTDTLPVVQYNEPGENKSVVYVVSPITGNQSANHNFQVDVSTPAGYIVETTTGEDEFNEGDEVQVKITLDKQNTLGDIYAYLKGDTDEDAAAVECKWKAASGGKGIKLANYGTSLSSGCKFLMLDGASGTGSTYSYQVVFLTESMWTDDPAARVTAFRAKNTLRLTTYNVLPKVEFVDINDGNYEIYEAGTTIGPFPINVPQKFRVYVDEPGKLDKTATGEQAFAVRWKFTPQSGSPTTLIVSGNPDSIEAYTNFTFASAGTYTVDVDLQDKDIAPRYANRDDDTETGPATTGINKKFRFFIEVIDRPTITVEHSGPYEETTSVDAGGEAFINVKLSMNDCTFPMDVKLLIAPNNKESTAPGAFLLQTGAGVTSNGVETVGGESFLSYTVRFPHHTTEVPIPVQTMDGTADSRTTGFKVVVTNITETIVPDAHQRACDYYLGMSPSPIKVLNVAPAIDEQFDVYPIPTTNAIPASIGAADEAITWSFDDVELDFARGITVEFKGGGGWGPKTYYTRAEALADGAAGFTPSFSGSGPQSVKLSVKDRDGGNTTVVWEFEVEPSKSLKLVAHGPASGNVSKYASAAGIGQGRVWAESKSAIAVNYFASTINCGTDADWHIFGYGYKVGDIDDGVNLHKPNGFGVHEVGYYADRDTPVSVSGANLGTGTPFTYEAPSDDRGNPRDSFLYTWMVKTETETHASSGTSTGSSSSGADSWTTKTGFGLLNGQTAPEYLMVHDSGKTVNLPTEKNDDGSYAWTEAEAIFSIEYLASDNMGDINLDAIPDVYIDKYGFGQADVESGEVSGSDLTKVNALNADEDFLPPVGTSAYGMLIPGLAGSWVTAGRPFTAQLEIRGNGESLNDAPDNNSMTRVAGLRPDRIYTDPGVDTTSTLDGYDGGMPVEYLAWLDYAAANGLDAAETNNWTTWSPERPTDPTVYDTDGDGFPDGYEYFIWYRAHVGYNDGGVHRYLTGRAYDPRNPGDGKFIAREVIEQAFDPVRANSDFSDLKDTDNDGLPDLIEFAIGTNPIDFDTDGDGLPDGYEIMLAATSPVLAYTTTGVSDAMRNYDGDAMAYTSPYYETHYMTPTPKHTTSLSKFALVDPYGYTDGVQWFVMPTASVPKTKLVFTEDSSSVGLFFEADGNQYVTVDTNLLTVVRGGTERLAVDMSPDKTWQAGTYADTNGIDRVVRLMPARLQAGTVVSGSCTTNFGYVTFPADVQESLSAWPYGRSVSTETKGDTAANLGGFGFLAIGRYKTAKAGYKLACLPVVDDTIAYLHHLVYQEFGFDPRTAWNANTPLGSRWGTALAGLDDIGVDAGEGKANNVSELFNHAAVAARTREYTLYDEFLVMSFFLNGLSDGAMKVQPTSDRPWYKIWSQYTTNGRGPNEPGLATGDENYMGRDTEAGSADENGADTDGDGVPDGWELYVMSGPKKQTYLNGVPGIRFAFPAPEGDGYMSSFGPFVPDAKNASMTDNKIEQVSLKTGYTTLGGDADDLNEYREFAGTDTTIYYSNYSTTVTRPEEDAKWLNKFFPTDPWNADTDGDGLTDKYEGSGNGPRGGGWGFVYGTPADNGKLVSIPGGGLNPLSVDTDKDGLPDAWEYQFNGETIYSGDDATYAASDNGQGNPLEGLIDGMDGTVFDSFNIPNGHMDEDGGIGTIRLTRAADGIKIFGKLNRDYDNDGLENWQEYMVGTMRCWRYDDILSAWDAIPDSAYWNAKGEFSPNYAKINELYGTPGKPVIDTSAADGGRGEFWYKTLVDNSSPIYNPRLITDQAPGDHYLSRITNVWDPVYVDDENGGAWYYFYNRIGEDYLSDLWALPFMTAAGKTAGVISPGRYISCSPLKYDSDSDGMDDYYELFHGMNPLLGGDGLDTDAEGSPCDLVRDAWGGADSIWKAWDDSDPGANFWTYQVSLGNYYKTGAKPRGNGYDFEYFPWLNGLASADPDGDDLRNQNEAIMPKLASFAWHHTDPTPLWMTDSSYARSLTRLFYRMPGRGHYAATLGDTFKYKGKTYYFADFGGWAPADLLLPARFVAYSSDKEWGVFGAEERNWMFSFEENEGYDSDHDAMSDCAESAGKLRSTSDPQDSNSPNRRQAMYFQGPSRPSALQSPPEILEKYPVTQESWPSETAFLQFTVEAWVNADTLDDATVVERAIWCAKSKPGDEEYVRKNFQLGIRGGKWYAKYDGNGTLEGTCVEIFSSDDAETGKWHHLAATYNGARFVLYVDGTEAATPIDTTLQPEYGSGAMVFHRYSSFGPYPYSPGDYWYNMDYTLRPIVIGASLKTQAELGPVADQSAAFDVHNGAGWSYYNRFFKGFIDEVRIWDGARTVADIRSDMRTRYTREKALDNRTAFYEGWVKYGNRYGKDSDGDPVSIVPELRYHFSFDSVPGGADEGITAKVPAGFDYHQEAYPAYGIAESGAAYLSRPVDWHVAWWSKVVDGYGSVYGSTNWVQWVPNTVAHLPRFDGTTLDSFFWSENTCGDEEGSYSFARNAEPASRWTQFTYNAWPDWRYYCTAGFRHHLVCELDGLVVRSDDDGETYTNDLRRTASRFTMFRFTGRTSLQDGLDLLPLGGAYAKICPEMWDGQGVSTIWEITSDDDNDNGLPDAWEEYAIGNYSPATTTVDWDTIVTWNGRRMTAGEAYRHDIATGRIVYTDSSGDPQVATTPLADMKMTSDEDASHTPDWWDDLYGVYGEGGTTDTDNDGLNNYVEYLVSEVFPFNMALDPKKPKSDSTTLDYFRKIGKLYLGEMFTDHDHMEDHWERATVSDTIDANVWDAQRDGDEDGWSNFAEVRYNSWCHSILAQYISHSIGDEMVLDIPKPTIKLTARYNGKRDLAALASSGLPTLRVLTYTDKAMDKVDAKFEVRAGENSDREFYMGKWENRVIHGTLDPGNVSYHSLKMYYAKMPSDTYYSWKDWSYAHSSGYTGLHIGRSYEEFHQALVRGEVMEVLFEDSFTWDTIDTASFVDGVAQAFTVTIDGAIMMCGKQVGLIDLISGDFDFDMSAMAAVCSDAGYKDTVYKLVYTAKVPDVQFDKVDVSLAQPDSGFVRGGKNSIMAFWDLDNDGVYTPGTDPFGVARDVEVGWRECSVEIEMSETSAIAPRIKLWQGVAEGSSGSSGSSALTTSDRIARFGQFETFGDLTKYVPSANIDAIRVRVIRLEIDDMRIVNISGVKNPWRVLVDRTVDRNVRDWLHEGDLLGDGALDIDWNYMYGDLNIPNLIKLKYALTNAVYAVVFGHGDIPAASSDLDASLTVHPVLITRRFEQNRTYPTAVAMNGDSACRVAQPTFRWKIENEDPWASAFGTTYTAFKVKVWNSSGAEVYDSGYQRMPAADSTGVYSWTAPLYVDCPSPSGSQSHLVFRNFEKYTWKVYTYNSKFKDDGTGSAAETFRMNVTELDMSSFGTGIDVRYAGPVTTSSTHGLIHVQAFETPDFTGIPVAEAVTNASGMVNLTGLRSGTYFLRAYVDTDYDWTLDDWESWGYLSERDHGAMTGTKSIFSPVSVTVGPNLKPDAPRILYIEDRDTDGDGFPDAWEAEQNGYVFSRKVVGPATGDAEFFAVNTNLSSVLNSADTMDLLKRNQLMQMFLLGRGGKYGVSLLTGASVSTLKATSLGALRVPSAVVEDTLAITSLEIDRTTGEVVLGVGAETEEGSVDPVVAALYSISCDATVTVKVYRTETLAAEWELVDTIEDVSLSSAGTEVRVKLSDGLDTSSGFFKVEIE